MAWKHYSKHKYLVGGFALIIFLMFSYAVPFPYNFLTGLEAGNIVRDVHHTTSLDAVPHSITESPAGPWQSLTFMIAPLSVLLYAIQLSRDDLIATVPLVIAAGAISGILGVMQLIGGVNGQLYPYQITNYGSAVGVFANRNHAAVLLATLFPMLAFFAASVAIRDAQQSKKWQLLASCIAIILVPLILVTGSRSGLLAAIMGLAGAAFIYKMQHKVSDRSNTTYFFNVAAPVILVCLIFLTIYFSRAVAIDRFFYESALDNNRGDFWQAAVKQFWSYYPFGFGPGSFVAVYQVDEPLPLLEGPYLNRLHNDWLETALTFGVPGILLMFAGLSYYVRRSFILWMRMDGANSNVLLGRTASVVIGILALASMSDYPLRTPALAGFAALALVWFAHAHRESKTR